MPFLKLLALFSLLLAGSLAAQQQPIVVRAARMVDVSRGQLVAPAVVVVSGGKIRSIGASDVPAGARTIDLGDLTLLPGLIDAHTHLTMDISGDWVTRSVRELPADAALRGAHNARLTLLAGFTTVRDVGAGGFADISLMNAIDAGMVIGPRMIPAAHAIGITGGHCDETGWAPGVKELSWKDGVADGVDEVVKAVRYQIKHGAKVIKVCATAGVLSFDATLGAQQLSDEELRAIVQEANRHGLKVAAHAHGTEGIKAAVRAGVASIEHGSMLDDQAIELMKRSGTYLVPTAYLFSTLHFDSMPPAIAAKARQVDTTRPGEPSASGSCRSQDRAGYRCGSLSAWRQCPRAGHLCGLRNAACRCTPRRHGERGRSAGSHRSGRHRSGEAGRSHCRAGKPAGRRENRSAGVVGDEGRSSCEGCGSAGRRGSCELILKTRIGLWRCAAPFRPPEGTASQPDLAYGRLNRNRLTGPAGKSRGCREVAAEKAPASKARHIDEGSTWMHIRDQGSAIKFRRIYGRSCQEADSIGASPAPNWGPGSRGEIRDAGV